MALTADKLKTTDLLKDLTDEQITAITSLSLADEGQVIGTKIGELHGRYEQDILELSGVAKNSGEKAYDYNKRVLNQFKQKASSLSEELEKVKKEGSTDKELIKTIDKQKADLALLTQQLATKEEEYKTQLHSAKVDFQFKQASSNVKLKETFQGAIADVLFEQGKNEILSTYTPDFVDNEMVFRDKTTNEIVRNPKDNLKPMTIKDLYKNTVLATALAEDKTPGGGTEPPKPEGSPDIAIAGAKTQVEADIAIHEVLSKKGFVRGTAEYASEQQKVRTENKVDKLPIR